MDILRFITAGNVDDGKSTLIGRLLYDTGNIKSDILQSVANDDEANAINLAHITDGLRAEREQGITIDVAYKYFTTAKRKFIITDAPGHYQYTKNLVTGASGADVMIVLIDALNGITDQTRRHSLVASFLGIKRVVVAINKMDAVDYDEQIFITIKNEYLVIANKLSIQNVTFIPISALHGDNVSFPSVNMPWYMGITLMQYLENCEPILTSNDVTRFSVQFAIGTAEIAYAGKMLSGKLNVGDQIQIFPGEQTSIVGKITKGYATVIEAVATQNICVHLQGDIVVNRGNIIVPTTGSAPMCSIQFEANICWLNSGQTLQINKDYFLRIACQETIGRVTEVIYKTDINSFEKYNDNSPLEVNEFARVKIETNEIIAYDFFSVLPETGRGIIIDTETNYTSAALVIKTVLAS